MDFRIVERVSSDNEAYPTVLLANIHGVDVKQNLAKMEQVIEVAHRKKVNLVIFPELTVTGYIWDSGEEREILDLFAEGDNNHIHSWINNIKGSLTESGTGLEYVFYGNVREKDGAYLNSTFVLNSRIDYRAEEFIYDKVFLPSKERRYFRQGSDKRLAIDSKWGRIGLLICYDLCFVELARQYAFIDGVDAIITMAAWQSEAVREYSRMNVRTDHYYGFLWDLMNASKSAYNQVWSMGANWVGAHHKTGEYFWGGSGVWAPSGMKLLQASNINEEILIIRNLDIKGKREKETDPFNYRIDFENFYRHMEHPVECTRFLP